MPKPRRGATDLNGVLLIDKPSGCTSHDVVDRVRAITGEGRVGHAGTLDPAATGLMVVLVGPAAKFSEQFTGLDKCYLARVAFGSSTTTDDADGETLEEAALPQGLADAASAKAVLAQLTGQSMQVPPQFSAIKQAGKAAYSQARQGLQVKLAARPVTIYSLELIAAEQQSWDIVAEVSKGTYIRALARDLGALVGCPAHLSELRRLAVGSLRVEQALSLEQLAGSASIQDYLIPAESLITELKGAAR